MSRNHFWENENFDFCKLKDVQRGRNTQIFLKALVKIRIIWPSILFPNPIPIIYVGFPFPNLDHTITGGLRVGKKSENTPYKSNPPPHPITRGILTTEGKTHEIELMRSSNPSFISPYRTPCFLKMYHPPQASPILCIVNNTDRPSVAE